MSDPISFQATIYRNILFDQDGGGRVTLQFDAQQEAAILHLLTCRKHLLTVTVERIESY